jgi:hypothetical protein
MEVAWDQDINLNLSPRCRLGFPPTFGNGPFQSDPCRCLFRLLQQDLYILFGFRAEIRSLVQDGAFKTFYSARKLKILHKTEKSCAYRR